MSAARTLHVRCTTWEQVEVFYTRKLRRGKLLSMKVPFLAEPGGQVTLGLELPNQVVIAIDGRVQKASPMEGDPTKTWIEIELVGFTDAVIARIKAMMAGTEMPEDPTPPPVVPVAVSAARVQPFPSPVTGEHELPGDERALFQHLTAELRRLRQVAVHEVLGVERDADTEQIRAGWMELVRKHHPDLVARHHAPAISHLAEELTILCNRAYDRLRVAMVAEGRATAVGSVLQQPAGWLVGFEDISSSDAGPARVAKAANDVRPPPVAERLTSTIGTSPPPISQVQGGEAFETRARAMLGDGDADNAQEVLAAALCVYPRSRPLRSLYYVASALSALQKGEVMLATSQLETALAHHEQCLEAAQILEHLRKHGHARNDEIRRLFR
jgi:hypothetical protein